MVCEGDEGIGFYLIVDGSAEVRRSGKVLSRLGQGNFFGEMTLLDEQPSSADVVAVEPIGVSPSHMGLSRYDMDLSEDGEGDHERNGPATAPDQQGV